jgi:hypothetical protein
VGSDEAKAARAEARARRKRARDDDGGDGSRGSGALLPGDERVFDDAQVEAAMASMFEDESDPDVELDSEEEEELASMPADGGAGIKEMLAALAEQLKGA